ncbi:DNA polymerase kappa-like, partial [Saccoglossus kowalevskii]|uniref:DNA polymerase kappa n=1 Tax=Saccoglossus kowalevskii TaxID=10224 RepID=A0ABM0MLJ2_SACKO
MDARDIDSDSCHDNEDENWLETGWSEENPSFCVNQNYSKMKTPSPRHSMCKDNLGTSAKQAMRGAVTQDESNKTDSSKGVMSLMGLNTNKAGMEGLDKEKINSIILQASKGSKFYENEQKKEQLLNNKIEQMKEQLGKLTEQEKSMALVEVDKMVLELKAQRDLTRTIVHIDMDMFYAAVEMKDDPTLRDKPMAVGSMGMLSTSNYKARRFGVRAAMPGFIGKKLCPELILVKPNFVKYRAVSQEIQHIMGQYDPNFAAMSLDEAYLDLTEHLKLRSSLSEESRTFYYRFKENQSCRDSRDINQMVVSKTGNTATVTKSTDEKMVVLETGNTATVTTSTAEKMVVLETGNTATVKHDYLKDMSRYEIFGVSAEEAVREIRFRIEQKTQLTASAGIAPNTMLAKVCSDKNKPNGQYRIEPTLEAVNKFIEDLPIRK